MNKFLVLCALVCGCAAAASAQEKRTLDCKDPASIRAFKDAVMTRLTGVSEPGRRSAREWSVMLCGPAADKAGVNNPEPANPSSVPGMPGWQNGVKAEAYAKQLAKEYFGPNLPLTPAQASRLARRFVAAWTAADKAAAKKGAAPAAAGK